MSNLYNPGKTLSLASQTIYDHMFSDLKLDQTFYVFQLHTCIIFFSYRMWQLYNYFEDMMVL